MSFDLNNVTVSAETEEVPRNAVSRGRTYTPGPFDYLLANGPTPDGKAHVVPVPKDEGEAKNARKAIAAELQRAITHYNKANPDRRPLGFKTSAVNGKVYISITEKGKPDEPVTVTTSDADKSSKASKAA